MLTDPEIKKAVFYAWSKEPKRPPRVTLNIVDQQIFAIDADMHLHATRQLDVSAESFGVAVRHEFRHLTESPGMWHVWLDWAVLLAKEGYKKDDIQQILNIFTDIQVDHTLFKTYPDATKKWFEEFLGTYWKGSSAPEMFLYWRAHEKFLGTNLVNPPDPLQVNSAFSVPKDRLDHDAYLLYSWAVGVNIPSAATIEYRIKTFAQILAPYLVQDQKGPDGESKEQQKGGFGEGHGRGQGQPQTEQEAKERAAEKAAEKNLTPDQAKEVMEAAAEEAEEPGLKGKPGYRSKPVTREEARDLMDHFRVLSVFQRVVKVVARVKGRQGLNIELQGVWRPGDLPEELDIPGTISRFGVVIPNVTAMKTTPFTVQKSKLDEKGAKMCIEIDESGSVNTEKWNREMEAAIGLVAYAMEKKTPVHVIKFDSPYHGDPGYVQFSEQFSYSYWDVMRWIIRRRLEGGTEIHHVFEVLSKLQNIAGSTIIVLTDCGIGLLNKAKPLIRELASRGCVFRIFAIGEAEIPDYLKEAFDSLDVLFFAVPNVTESLTEDAIKSLEMLK